MENTELQTFSSEVVDNIEMSEVTERPEENTESPVDNTELGNEEIDSTELIDGVDAESGNESEAMQESSGIPSDELTDALNSVLDEYFEENTIQVEIVGNNDIHKPLEDLTLTEICLVSIVLILLGRSILHIIGGRAWNR